MAYSKKVVQLPITSKTEAIHKHLQTQFEGLLIKFAQEIEEILQIRIELRNDLEHLKHQLHTACDHFCQAPQKGCMEAIEQFCKNCSIAINCYKKAPAGYRALARNGIARETMDNIIGRFTNSVNAVISYTKEYNHLNSSSDSSTILLLESIKARFFSTKLQITAIHDEAKDEDDVTHATPSNRPEI